jgi:tetratricopeptide (TPR) repeat protein
MRSIAFEFVLKGVFLGLWAAAALRQSPSEPSLAGLMTHVLWTLAGLGIGLAFALVEQVVRGQKPWRNPVAGTVLVLFEGSYWLYLGLVGGLGASLVYGNATAELPPGGRNWLIPCTVAGGFLGFGFVQLSQVADWRWRFGLAAVIGAGLVAVVNLYLDDAGWLETEPGRRTFGLFILLGLPFFYLLTVCGVAEESEVEIAALCAGMGIGIHLLKFPPNLPMLGFLLPILIYVVYITKWISGLRGFKHTLRGYGYLNAGQLKPALLSFRRARQVNPKNALATQGLYDVHRRIEPAFFDNDPELADLLDFSFCLDRAEQLLVGGSTPTATARDEAGRMIALVAQNRPQLRPRIDYLDALRSTYDKRFDNAAAYLARLLDPAEPADPAVRQRVLLPAWDLALRLHPELIRRLGDAELAKPGRRMEAIAAVERALANDANHPVAGELKALVYAGLTEGEFRGNPPAAGNFNFDHVEQIGLALIDDADPARRDRGMANLRIAASGLPARAATLFQKLAATADAAGDRDAARGYREQIKRVGLEIGPAKLPVDQKSIYFETVKQLVAEARRRGDYESAAADQRLLIGSGGNELEQYRTLADDYEKAGDPLNALLAVETARLYKADDPDLQSRKDKYYFSVSPERLAAVRDKVDAIFDVTYCVTKANAVLATRDADLDLLDWAEHLTTLARVMKPDLLAAKVAEGRIRLRKGDRDGGLSMLEDVREAKPNGADEKEAWFVATRVLGELYLNELNRPDLAAQCFRDYKEHPKSGADTLYWLGKSYEAANDVSNAIRFYDAVTAYEGHPRSWEAAEAVRRLKG